MTKHVVLTVLFSICFFVFVVTDLLVNGLFNADIYTKALDETNAYSRFHTEFLSDPNTEGHVIELFGMEPESIKGQGVYSLVTSTLYLVFPPHVIQSATEIAIRNTFDYINGTDHILESEVDVTYSIEHEALTKRILYLYELIVQAGLEEEEAFGIDIPSDKTLKAYASETASVIIHELSSSKLYDLSHHASEIFNTERNSIVEIANVLRRIYKLLQFIVLPMSLLGMIGIIAYTVSSSKKDRKALLKQLSILFLISASTVFIIYVCIRLVTTNSIHDLFEMSSLSSIESLNSILFDVTNVILRELWIMMLVSTSIFVLIGLLCWILSRNNRFHLSFDKYFDKKPHHVKPLFLIIGATILISLPILSYASRKVHQLFPECNGHLELCNMPYDEVATVGTHNGMSIAEYGWLWPSHDGTVTDQLYMGVRTLLLDTHYYDLTQSLSSYFPNATEKQLNTLDKLVTEAEVVKKEGVYLCHIICHIGSTPLEDTLTEIKTFLDGNPREVITIVFEDKITPEDTQIAFEQTGLIEYVYAHDPENKWPTIGNLIENNTRLVVFAEKQGGTLPWYHDYYAYAEETPYSFTSPEELNCAPNRGAKGNDLFLINHWIERVAPSRVDSTRINQYEVLKSRVQECQNERSRLPNVIAINFFLIGDALRLVDELNGVAHY